MARTIHYSMEERHGGMKVYDVLRREGGLSYRLITELKHWPEGILLNGAHVRTIDRVRAGDTLTVTLPDQEARLEPSGLAVPVAYEDDDVIVYDKPAGMNCHPSRRFQSDTLANVFAAHCQAAGQSLTFRCLNRLDKDTSGLVLLGKNQHAAALLKFAVQKEYRAIVHGVPDMREGCVDVPISRINDIYTKRQPDPNGQPARTHYAVEAVGEGYSLCRLRLETGRTHQIRVHMAYLGHPLAGDDMYGGSVVPISRQALHCCRMWFTSPISGRAVELASPLPPDLEELVQSAKIYTQIPYKTV